MTKAIFFAKRSDRLIARLKLMFYTWRFADQIGGQVVMVWAKLPPWWRQFDGEDYSPYRLFDLREFYARGGASQLVFLEGQIGYPEVRRSLRDPEFARERAEGFDRSMFGADPCVFYEQGAPMYRFKDEPNTRAHFQETLRSVFDRLPLDSLFERTLAFTRSRIGAPDYIAVHVRRGDVAEMLRQDLPKLAGEGLTPAQLTRLMGHYVCRTARDEDYGPEIEDAIGKGKRILYASDSPETLAGFAKKFGRRHFIDCSIFNARYPIQKAFLDFNLLTGASKIVSTGSSYASFAATLGGGEIVNVAARGSVDELEQTLYDVYLNDVSLPPQARAQLRDELALQHDRWRQLRRLGAGDEADGPSEADSAA